MMRGINYDYKIQELDTKIKKIETEVSSLVSNVNQNLFSQQIINNQLKDITDYIKQNFVLRTITIHLPSSPTSDTTFRLPYKEWYDSGVYVVNSSYNTLILPENCKPNYIVQIFNYTNFTISVKTNNDIIFSKLYAPVNGTTNIGLEPNRYIILYYQYNNNLSRAQWTANII